MNTFTVILIYLAAFIIVWAINGAKLPRWFHRKNTKHSIKNIDIHIEIFENKR